jgi:transcriptional regulator with XRE-family HTH domain
LAQRVRKERLAKALESIAANVRRCRLRQGLTQETVAEYAEIDLTYLQRIERGRANITVSVLLGIADALDVEPDRLFRPARLEPARRGRPKRGK